MMRRILTVGLIVIFFPCLLFAGTPVWTKTNGPRGGDVYSIAVHPVNPEILFAATAESGLFVSMDSGAYWKPSNYGQARPIETVAISKPNPSILYGASAFQFVFKSQDGGKTWSSQNIGSVWIYDIVLDPSNVNVAYLATDSGVLKSTDAGGQWNPANTGLTNTSVRSLAMDPTNANILYAATAGGVFKSTNGAFSWASQNSGLASLDVRSIAIDPQLPLSLYAGTAAGISKSINAAGSWTNTSVSGGVGPIVVDPINSNNVYAGSNTGGMLRSTNYGAIWSFSNNGLTGKQILSLAADPEASGIVYTAIWGTGIFRSSDFGNVWAYMSNGLNASNIRGLAVDQSMLFAAADAGVPYSYDGRTWGSAAAASIPDLAVYSVAVDPLNSNTAFAGTGKGVYKKSGSSWVYTGLSSYAVISLKMSPTDSNTLYAGTSSGVYKTIDGGSSWNPYNSGLGNTQIRSLAIDPAASNYIYAATGSGVWVSTNSAGSWGYVGPAASNVQQVVHDPISHLVAYALVSNKLYKTSNGGGNWPLIKTFNSGISHLGISKANPSILYALADGSVYRSDDGGASWNEIGAGISFTHLRSVEPNSVDPSIAYLATEGKGIYRLVDAKLWDDFTDYNLAGWTVSNGSWGAGTAMLGGSTTKKARIFSAAFDPCSDCTIEADVQLMTPAGKAVIYGWYKDKANYIQVELNDAKNKVKVMQKVQGTTIWKKSAALNIDPMMTYHVKIDYHGGEIGLIVDGQLMVLNPATIPSAGMIGFLIKASDGVNTSARFDNIVVY